MSADPKMLQQLPGGFGVSRETSARAVSPPISQSKNAQGTSSDWRTDQIALREYAKLVQRVFLRPTGEASQVVVFAAIDPGNGCSRTCRRTAEVLAGTSSGTVCLVEAEFFDSPQPPRIESGASGSTDSLPGGAPIRTYVHEMETPNLWALSRGGTRPTRNNPVTIEAVGARLQELRQEFDRVLIDAPPLNQCSDAMSLAQLGDGLIVIIEANATRRQTARKVMETLGQAGVKVLGVVLNKRKFPIPERLYRQL